MSTRLIFLASFVLVLGLAAGVANADITSGLVGYYPLDEGAGDTAYDMSGNGHNGTLYNGVTWISQAFTNGGVNLDGTTNTRIELGTWNPAEGTGQLSLALWIRWAGGGPQFQGLVGKRDTWPGETMFQFQLRPETFVQDARGSILFETGDVHIYGDEGLMIPFIGEWAHAAVTFDGTTARLYLNGEEIESGAFALNTAGEAANMGIGCVTGGGAGYSGNGEVFLGDIDEVYIHNRALSLAEIRSLGARYSASNPSPLDADVITDTDVALTWTAGTYADSHHVYFGTNFDDVYNGTGGTDKGLSPWTVPVYWAPDLQIGTTYYWRIDEVSATHPDSPWRGPVWSFTIPPETAWIPNPADGAKFIDPEVTLSWSKGMDAFMHHVYFGDDFNDVSNADTSDTTGIYKGPKGDTTFYPGPLALDTVYYWRIDEQDPGGTLYPGDVWSFTTISPYAGVRAEYYQYTSAVIPPPRSVAFGTRVLTRIESEIDHHWGAGSPDPLINAEQFAGRWTAELEVAFSEPYTFWTLTDDGVRVWLDGELIIDDWTDHGDTWNSSQPINLVAGQRYVLVMEWFENAGGATAELDWASPSVPRQVIPAGPLQLLLRASSPDPFNGATGVKETPTLKWNAGEKAVQHDVYFGTDRAAVAAADTTTTGIYRGRQDSNDYVPTEAPLQWDQTYYWRIDEVNTLDTEGIWKGSIWSFTVADFLIVDNFEDYNDFTNRIYLTWIDGYGSPSQGIPGNGTGSTVGHLSPPYAEQIIVHEGLQAMPMDFNNVKLPYRSEAERTFDTPQDWTTHGAHDLKSLTLWFRGLPASVGSFSYDPATGIYTMTAAGVDIWNVPDFAGAGEGNYHDEFHYAHKQLSSAGSVVAQVRSVENTDGWAKAGVMIRETLDANSMHAMVVVTPGNGVAFQGRTVTGGVTFNTTLAGITAPHWVRLTRTANTFTGEHSTDGSDWQTIDTQEIPMGAGVHVGLALTSHNTDPTVACTAEFSDVALSGTATGEWKSRDIGITSNNAEQLYVVVEDSAGKSEVANHQDPNAVLSATWQSWDIPLTDFSSAGVDLTSVKKVYIGVGDRKLPKPGGAGKLYIDDIRLYQPRCFPALVRPAGDFSNDCLVDYLDLDVMTDNWLITDYDVTPVAPGTGNLVAYYALESNTNDGSGNGHHGDPCGAPTYVAGPAGYGTAMHFDGTSPGNYVDLGTFDPSAATGELTVALWAKWDGLSGYWQGLIAKRDTWSATDMMWQLEADVNTGTLGFFRYGSPYFTNSALPVGQWTHVAASFDGTTVSFYIDAELTSSGPFSFGPGTEVHVVFGACEDNGGNPFNGALDEIRIYDEALLQAEVAHLAGKTAVYTQPLHLLLTPQDPAIDMNSDGTIDLKDYALLVDMWLDELLWPQR